MKKKQLRASLLLLLCAFVWGSTFVAQSTAAEKIPTFTFLAARSFVGAAALFVIAFVRARRNKGSIKSQTAGSGKSLLLAGLGCGAALFVASACQQYGMQLGTGAGKAGFLTSLYLVFVPLLGFLFFGRKPGWQVIGGGLLALAGLFFLCDVAGEAGIGAGDFITAVCGLCFALHILIIDRFCEHIDGVQLSFLQFFVCGVLSLASALLFETPTLSSLQSAWGSILYAGLFSSALGYTLQILGQKDCPPAVATVLMSLESVFALASDTVIAWFNGKPTPIRASEAFGCLFMFAGVLLVQIPKRGTTK